MLQVESESSQYSHVASGNEDSKYSNVASRNHGSQYSHVASGNEDSTVVLQVEMKAVFSVAHTATVYSFAIKKKKRWERKGLCISFEKGTNVCTSEINM